MIRDKAHRADNCSTSTAQGNRREFGYHTTENEIGDVVLRIANDNRNETATFPQIRKILPFLIDLSLADCEYSATRPNEELWEQRVRNIKSNSSHTNNYIFEGYLEHVPRVGYRITEKGKARLKLLDR